MFFRGAFFFFLKKYSCAQCKCKAEPVFAGTARVKLFAWGDGSEQQEAVGGQWVLGSVLLWGLRSLVTAR